MNWSAVTIVGKMTIWQMGQEYSCSSGLRSRTINVRIIVTEHSWVAQPRWTEERSWASWTKDTKTACCRRHNDCDNKHRTNKQIHCSNVRQHMTQIHLKIPTANSLQTFLKMLANPQIRGAIKLPKLLLQSSQKFKKQRPRKQPSGHHQRLNKEYCRQLSWTSTCQWVNA